jgi:molybdopterin/thiamine biosynthesis adenylyltransferase
MGNEVLGDIKNQSSDLLWQEPIIFNLSEDSDRISLLDLKRSNKIIKVIDNISLAWGELFDIEYPAKKDNKSELEVGEFVNNKIGGSTKEYGYWVFFPWSGYLVHFPEKNDLRKLRTSRNRNLINKEEQSKLYKTRVLVLGLSIGSNVVEALVSQGIGGALGIVDLDILEPTNLNRVRSSYFEVGIHKVDVVAKKISEIDPFIEQIHFRDGITEANYQDVMSRVKPDVIIDEMDDLRMKIMIREYAMSNNIPVVMATDDGDDVLVDIERFDVEGVDDIFHGILPLDIISRVKNKEIENRNKLGQIIGQYFVGFENVPPRMMESLKEVGVTLPSWPQLGGAAAMAGISVAYAVKEIIIGSDNKSRRFLCGPGVSKELM